MLTRLSVVPFLAALSIGVNSVAVEPATPGASAAGVDCATVACRAAGTMTLVDARGEETTVRVVAGPIVRDDVLTLVPGERFSISGDSMEDRLHNLRVVQDSEKGGTTLLVSFGQAAQGGGPTMTCLRIENRLSKLLRYQAKIQRAGSPVAELTTVCEVAPGKTSYELWPEAIQEVQLFNLRFREWKEGESLRCE